MTSEPQRCAQPSFPGIPAPPPPSEVGDSAGRRRTKRAAEAIAGGVHPMTRRPLLTTGETCGDCSHLNRHGRYFKCDLMKRTHGPATDIRKSWPACDLFGHEATPVRETV